MKMNEKIQTVLSAYTNVKARMWSKTAKRILGVHLFGNKSLTVEWEKTYRKWWEEMNSIEDNYGPIPMLDARGETMQEFFGDVIDILFSKGHLTTGEHKNIKEAKNSLVKPQDSYAQAIIVKTFFEASMNRSWGKKFGSTTRFSIYSDELFTRPLGSLLQGRAENEWDLEKQFLNELD
jgi:hypothetical protein